MRLHAFADMPYDRPEVDLLHQVKRSLAKHHSLRDGKAAGCHPEQVESLVKAELAKVLYAITAQYGLRRN